MTNQPKAYNELVGVLLSEEDRLKFEWAIGAMLSEGPNNVLIVHGDPMTGKSTLLNIVRKILLSDVRAVAARTHFQHNGYERVDRFHLPNPYVFAAELSEYDPSVEDGAIHISTTGDCVSVNKHYVLMNQIDVEALDVAEHCINVYRNNNFQENNR
ncbi:hypothetical protein SscP1EGY_27 [Streptomyces phage SscP1EGY]|nr:hypothetical protein SscP1EGY_27 [Streptomyces phage SscP1EGY]